MRRILLILVLFSTTIALSQKKTFENEVSKISKKIEKITKLQKDSLKIKVLEIDKRLDKGELTKTTAENLKKEVAAYHARQIEEKISEQERLLQVLVQNKTNGKIASSEDVEEDDISTFSIGNKTFRFTLNNTKMDSIREERRRKKKGNRKTTSQFVFAMGVNNALVDNQFSSLNDSEYKFWASHFYEVGLTWKTRLNNEASKTYFKYGISFLWNNLRLKDNQYHVKNGDITEIQTSLEGLSESRLRHVQMNFPLHLEWDFSKNRTYNNGFVRDRRNKSVRFGIGGFFGFKLGTRQYLEYVNSEGVKVEEVQKNNFNMNIFNYGLSTYIGYRSISLYVKYDLNPLFKDTNTRNISLGVRFDLD